MLLPTDRDGRLLSLTARRAASALSTAAIAVADWMVRAGHALAQGARRPTAWAIRLAVLAHGRVACRRRGIDTTVAETGDRS